MLHFTERALLCALKKKIVTDRSGHGRREGAVHVGGVVHVAHHDVTWIALVCMAFTVQVLEFCCRKSQNSGNC